MKHDSFNESTEMYLKTVSELANGDSLVPISALAERMGVSTVSATEMVHRLCDQGLLDHMPYRGVLLTVEGRRRACLVIRRHRLWERFLSDRLQLPWPRVHDVACQLEHVTEDDATEALAVYLGHPATCPHGNPIPGPRGELAPTCDTPLSDWAPGDCGTITRVHPESTLLLDYLASRQIFPGQAVAFTEIAPFNGPLMMEIGGQPQALGREVAAHIYGKRHDA
ncbi:MAG: metal-dependent transcriptional regulator [Anaerolineales bacterium]|nr:metal-dependent transcriptional regulator [Anaerolineales bacterium]